MSRGGYRPGAGRKPKGWPGKPIELAANQMATAIAVVPDGGKSPLQFLLEMMRNTKLDDELRVKAAIAALPFVHPRIQARIAAPEQPTPKADALGKKAQRLEDAARPATGDWAGLLDIPGRSAN